MPKTNNLFLFQNFLFIGFLFQIFSCGTPNPFELNNTTNPPTSVVSHFQDNCIFLEITSFNTFDTSPGFLGYNIYFGTINSEHEIKQKRLYFEDMTLPTIKLPPHDNFFTSKIKIEQFRYTNFITKELEIEELQPFRDYYFIINSFDANNKENNNYLEITHIKIPLTYTDQNIKFNNELSLEQLNLNVSSSRLSVIGDGGLQSAGYTSSWTNLNHAPENGYDQTSIELDENYTYFFKISNDYVKVYFFNKSSTGVDYNISYQKNSLDFF